MTNPKTAWRLIQGPIFNTYSKEGEQPCRLFSKKGESWCCRLLCYPGSCRPDYLPGAGPQKGNLPPGQFLDSRHNHNRPYPAPGQFIDLLPQGHRVVFWGKERYHFSNGVWYRPIGRQFLVVAPPVGIMVPFLPSFHTTFWVNGVPYYYANEVYYTQSPVGYEVAERPKGEISQTPPGKRLFIYPRQNQSARIQEIDHRACQTWALNQTNFNPEKLPADMTETRKNEGQDAYQRAMKACLEARGYAVK